MSTLVVLGNRNYHVRTMKDPARLVLTPISIKRMDAIPALDEEPSEDAVVIEFRTLLALNTVMYELEDMKYDMEQAAEKADAGPEGVDAQVAGRDPGPGDDHVRPEREEAATAGGAEAEDVPAEGAVGPA